MLVIKSIWQKSAQTLLAVQEPLFLRLAGWRLGKGLYKNDQAVNKALAYVKEKMKQKSLLIRARGYWDRTLKSLIWVTGGLIHRQFFETGEKVYKYASYRAALILHNN